MSYILCIVYNHEWYVLTAHALSCNVKFVYISKVFSTSGNMEKRITLHIPKEFPILWAGIGGGLGTYTPRINALCLKNDLVS